MAFNREKALKQAEKLVAKGKEREAIAKYQEVVDNDPTDGIGEPIGETEVEPTDGVRVDEGNCFERAGVQYEIDVAATRRAYRIETVSGQSICHGVGRIGGDHSSVRC